MDLIFIYKHCRCGTRDTVALTRMTMTYCALGQTCRTPNTISVIFQSLQ